MDLETIKQLLALMAENDLVELELEHEGKKVRLRKGGDHAPVSPSVVVTSGNGVVPMQATAAPAAAEAGAAAKRPSNIVEVKSPLVGTFYAAPKPGADPFINVGDVIGPDRVVCIVEAMKVMNEIKAEVSGRVVQILAKNAQPVEFNEPLFLVEKSESA
jgi:acetyl-CoA carboxylase biotin carboxyl carrier protein